MKKSSSSYRPVKVVARKASGAARAPDGRDGNFREQLRRLDQCLFLLFIFSLGFMQPALKLFGFHAVGSDFIYVVTLAAFGLSMLAGARRFVWDKAYWLLGLYLAAFILSAIANADASVSLPKLATQLYLLSIPVIARNLLLNASDVRRAVLAWAAATVVVILVGFASLATFLVDPDNPLLRHTRFYFGTLPSGDYPRFRLTFLNGNMLCNYLSASFSIVIAARLAGWLSGGRFAFLIVGTVISALLTISPGIGGIILVGGLWLWIVLAEHKNLARLALGAGLAGAALFVVAMTVTPLLHPTASFLINVSGLNLTLAPSGRLMTWIDASRNFASNPWFGSGIGTDAVYVPYQDPSGNLQKLRDAHNSFLSVAAQAGVIGLVAFCVILAYTMKKTLPLRLLERDRDAMRIGLGLTFLNGIAYQGLGGSFEDARHLWTAFGLFLVTLAPAVWNPRPQEEVREPR